MPKAKNLKYLRKRESLTQKAFAEAIGASKSTVIAWESKKSAIPVPTARRIAEYFDVDYSDFCDIDIEKRDKELIGDCLEHLTHEEMHQLTMFRQLSDTSKHILLAALDGAYKAEKGK